MKEGQKRLFAVLLISLCVYVLISTSEAITTSLIDNNSEIMVATNAKCQVCVTSNKDAKHTTCTKSTTSGNKKYCCCGSEISTILSPTTSPKSTSTLNTSSKSTTNITSKCQVCVTSSGKHTTCTKSTTRDSKKYCCCGSEISTISSPTTSPRSISTLNRNLTTKVNTTTKCQVCVTSSGKHTTCAKSTIRGGKKYCCCGKVIPLISTPSKSISALNRNLTAKVNATTKCQICVTSSGEHTTCTKATVSSGKKYCCCGSVIPLLSTASSNIKTNHVHKYTEIMYLTIQEKAKYGIAKDNNLYFKEVCSCGAVKGGENSYTKAILNYNDGEGYVNENVKALIAAKAKESGISYEYLLGTFIREGVDTKGTTYFGNSYIGLCINNWNKGNKEPLNYLFEGWFGDDMQFTVEINGVKTTITPEVIAAHPEYLSNIEVSLDITVANIESIMAELEDTEDEDEKYKEVTRQYAGTILKDNWSDEDKRNAENWTEAYYEYAMRVGTLEANGAHYTNPGVGAYYCSITDRNLGSFRTFLVDGEGNVIPGYINNYTENARSNCIELDFAYEKLQKDTK